MLSIVSKQRLDVLDAIIEQTFIFSYKFSQHPSALHHYFLVKPKLTLKIRGRLFFVEVA